MTKRAVGTFANGPLLSINPRSIVQVQICYALAIRNNLSTIRDVIVNPLGILNRKPYTALRKVLPQAPILDIERSLIVGHGMEQVVTVELRVVVASVAMAKAVTLAVHGELANNGRGISSARRALPVEHLVPVVGTSVVHAHTAAGRIHKQQPVGRTSIAIRTLPHGKLIRGHHGNVREGAIGRARCGRALGKDLDLNALEAVADVASSRLSAICGPRASRNPARKRDTIRRNTWTGHR